MEGNPGTSLHQPLQQGQIRVVTLYPGSSADSIRCTLTHAMLRPDMSYRALSYVWGDPKITSEISLEGSPYLITTNLYHALRSLRSPEHKLLMWVDALCINQSDVDERDREVLRMREIYQAASQVVLWVGSSEPYSPASVSAAFALVCKFEELPSVRATFSETGADIPSEEEESCLFILQEILNRECFQRAWIIQEIVMCDRIVDGSTGSKVVLWCDDQSVSLSLVAKYVAHIQKDIDEFLRKRLKNSYYSFIQDLREFYRLGIDPKRRLPIAKQLLQIFHYAAGRFKASIPHDRLYSFLGLIHGELPDSLRPNYRKSADAVFYGYAKYIIQETGIPAALEGISRTCPGQPSWVSDWTAGYNFDEKTPPSVRLLPDGRRLQAEGARIQAVARTLKSHVSDSVNGIQFHLQARERFLCQDDVLQRYGTGQAIFEEWIRLIYGDIYDRETEKRLYMEITGQKGSFRDKPVTQRMKFSYSAYVYATVGLTELVVFEDGTFALTMHTESQNLQPGDMAYNMKGFSKAVLLRPDGNEFRIVGFLAGYSEDAVAHALGDASRDCGH